MSQVCRKCNQPWWFHSAHHNEAPAEAIEGDFDGTWTGLYCARGSDGQ